ncbi:MAG: hypothetical protein ACLUD2_02720 [Clostridium sp.]
MPESGFIAGPVTCGEATGAAYASAAAWQGAIPLWLPWLVPAPMAEYQRHPVTRPCYTSENAAAVMISFSW